MRNLIKGRAMDTVCLPVAYYGVYDVRPVTESTLPRRRRPTERRHWLPTKAGYTPTSPARQLLSDRKKRFRSDVGRMWAKKSRSMVA